MRKLLTATLGCLSIALFSCQKEVDDIFANNGNNNNNTGLLVKTVTKDGSDSTVVTYSYDNSNRITGVHTIEISNGVASIVNETVVRNSQGIIQKIIAKSPDLAQYGLDSLVTNVRYDAASRHYTSRVFNLSISGFTVLSDSIVYSYDGSGKIIAMADYSSGLGNDNAASFEFTYAGANITTMKLYDINSGSPVLTLTQLFEFDTKPSPLVLGNEAFVLNGSPEWYSSNNIIKITANLVGDPDTHILNYNFTYNTFNKPLSADLINEGQPGGTITYYYN